MARDPSPVGTCRSWAATGGRATGGMPIGRMALFCLVRYIRSHPKQRAYHLSCRFRCKSQMINGWNLKLIPLKRKTIWTKPPFFLFHANFPGCKALKKNNNMSCRSWCSTHSPSLPSKQFMEPWNAPTHISITKLSISNQRRSICEKFHTITGWWFQIFFFHPYLGKMNPFWLIFFQRGNVQPTNQNHFFWGWNFGGFHVLVAFLRPHLRSNDPLLSFDAHERKISQVGHCWGGHTFQASRSSGYKYNLFHCYERNPNLTFMI